MGSITHSYWECKSMSTFWGSGPIINYQPVVDVVKSVKDLDFVCLSWFLASQPIEQIM